MKTFLLLHTLTLQCHHHTHRSVGMCVHPCVHAYVCEHLSVCKSKVGIDVCVLLCFVWMTVSV